MVFTLKNRIILFVLMVISLILMGSLGFLTIKIYIEHEPATLTDAVYFSVATISTLGYFPQSSALHSDVGKWFHIIYLAMGLAIIFGGIQTIIGPWFEMKIQRAERGWRAPLPKDAHVIICGYNELTEYLTKKLKMVGVPYIIIDKNPPENLPHIEGNCSEIKSLKAANIDRATALVTLLDEKNNALVALTARSMNDEINIIAVSTSESGEEIIKKSGANVVISKNMLLGKMIQYWATGDYKYEIFASVERLPVKEYRVKGSMAGKKISEVKFREKYGTILAIHRSGKIIANPSPDLTLKSGDTIIYSPRESDAQ